MALPRPPNNSHFHILCHHSALAHSSHCSPAHDPHHLSPCLALSSADSDCTLWFWLGCLPPPSSPCLRSRQNPAARWTVLFSGGQAHAHKASHHLWPSRLWLSLSGLQLDIESTPLSTLPPHSLSRIILTCPYGCPSPSWGHGLFPWPRFPICEPILFSVSVPAYLQPY